MTDFSIMTEGLEHPEGPIACDDGSVIVGELHAHRVTRVRPDGGKQIIAHVDGVPNGLAFGPDGALYCCNSGTRFAGSNRPFPVEVGPGTSTGSIDRIDPSTGKSERLYDSCDDVPLAGPNDLMFDRHGNFWFTCLGKPLGDREMLGGLYYAKSDGSSIRRIVGGIGLNGVGISPDGARVYAAASYLRWIMEFEAGPDPKEQGYGVIQMPGRIVVDYAKRRLLDSLGMEADGTIAQAVCFDEPGISRVNPETGEETTIPFPDALTTNIAFGGQDMRDAYVTLTTTGRLAKARWPAPGLRLSFNG